MQSIRQKLTYLAVTAFVLLILFIAIVNRPSSESVTYSRMLMGTVVEITFPDGDSPAAAEAAEAAFTEIARLEEIFSSYKKTSDISKITESAGKGPVRVDPGVVEVVEKAIYLSRLSGGAFDPTFGPLGAIWRFNGEVGSVPPPEEITHALKYVGYGQIVVDRENSSVGLATAGMSINLGGIAKGYIVGLSALKIRDMGIERAIVRAGGDMFIFNNSGQDSGREPGEAIKIGIRHPRKPGKIIGSISVTRGAVATSGDYERFFIKEGRRYHHIIDPSTGYPATGSQSATVVTEDPALADAFSTAVFILGAERGMEMVEAYEGVEAVIVAPDGSIRISSGLEGLVQIKESDAEGDVRQ